MTLVAALRGHARERPDEVSLAFDRGDRPDLVLTFAELDTRVRRLAAGLAATGIAPGERVLVAHEPGPDYVTAFLGCLLARVVAVPVYPPRSRRGLATVASIAGDAGAIGALVDDPTAWSAADAPVPALTWDDATAPDDAPDPGSVAPDDIAFLQYTSGSTAEPRGVVVRHRNLVANLDVIATVVAAGPGTRSVSWLPPYHDMGLIGGILQPVYAGFPVRLLSPTQFLHDPGRWLRAISETRADCSAAPTFAYEECVRRVPAEQVATLDLSSWRTAIVGAEPVDAATLDRFAERFAPAGFDPTAFAPCYGLAEATLFVTGTKRAGRSPSVRAADRDALAAGAVVDAHAGESTAVLVGCGRPGGDVEVAVVDPASGLRCPADRVGEVWTRGPSVAGGYWNRGDADDWDAELEGRRGWLRTGDLGFVDADGELFVAGRSKDVMIIRGVNHHPHAVESTLAEAVAGLRRDRVAVFSVDAPTGERAVAVVEVPRSDGGPELVDALRSAAAREHGIDLADVRAVRRGSLPRTTSGKLRRRATRAAYLTGRFGGGATAPADTAAAGGDDELTRLVAAALDTTAAAVPADRPLTSAGLDSLRAVRLRALVLDRFGVQLPVDELLDGLTRDGIAARLAAEPAPGPDRATPTEDAAAPTPGQQSLLAVDRAGGSAAYHLVAAGSTRTALPPERLAAALDVLVRRHPALRTVVDLTPDGVVTTHVAGAVPAPTVTGHDVTAATWDSLVSSWSAEPLPLATPPLLRAMVGRLPDGSGRVAVCVHHIAADAISGGVLAEELGAALRGELDPAEVPVARTTAAPAAGDLDYWHATLAGAAPPAGPVAVDLDAPDTGTDLYSFDLDEPLTRAIGRLAGRHRATPFMVLAGAFAATVSRYCGSDGEDVVIGTASAGRPDLAALRAVGFHTTTLPLRIDLTGRPTGGDLLARTRAACLGAYAHDAVPYEQILGTWRAGRQDSAERRLVRHLVVLHDRAPQIRLDGAVVELGMRPSPRPRFDVELHLTRRADGTLTGQLVTARPLAAGRPDDIAALVVAHLEELVRDEPRSLSAVPLPAAAATTVAGWEHGGEAPAPLDPIASLQRDARARPDDVAVLDIDDTPVPYRRLHELVMATAAAVRAHGAVPADVVGVLGHRGAPTLAAVLGVLATGCVYLPLDPDHPPARVADLVADTSPAVLLHGSGTTPPAGTAGPTVPIPTSPLPVDGRVEPLTPARDDAAAYLVHTSGSTGRPKGAVNTARGLGVRLAWARERMSLRPTDRVLVKTPVSFDVSVWELTLPIAAGAVAVVCAPGEHRDPVALHDRMRRTGVTVAHFVPSMLDAFLDYEGPALPSLRLVVVSGEALAAATARRLADRYPAARLLNLYGPAEAAIDVSAHDVQPDDRSVPIGRPVPGTTLRILTGDLARQPTGAPGQLYIGGSQVGRGYHARPATTAARFGPDPFDPGARLYATGDLARWRTDGTIEFLGRVDDQVKIRGQRVEPGEVAAALGTAAGVTSAAAVVASGELIGFVCGAAPNPDAVRRHVAALLPSAAVPAAVLVLPTLPVTTNGKLDRRALREVATARTRVAPARAPVAPRDPTETAIAALWRDVLGGPTPGVLDDFFDSGGDSLSAARLLARVTSRFGVTLALDEVLAGHRTVAAIAELLTSAELAQASDDELLAALDALDAADPPPAPPPAEEAG